MIEFKAQTIKANTDELHAIFLLKKNVQVDIIKIILGYLPIAAPETLKEWKVVITSVRQEYESMKEYYNYQTRIGTTYRGQEIPMNIGKAKENFDKDGKSKYFNFKIYKHMAKNCQKLKKEKNTWKCYECR